MVYCVSSIRRVPQLGEEPLDMKASCEYQISSVGYSPWAALWQGILAARKPPQPGLR